MELLEQHYCHEHPQQATAMAPTAAAATASAEEEKPQEERKAALMMALEISPKKEEAEEEEDEEEGEQHCMEMDTMDIDSEGSISNNNAIAAELTCKKCPGGRIFQCREQLQQHCANTHRDR
jgi:hypothetical protein